MSVRAFLVGASFSTVSRRLSSQLYFGAIGRRSWASYAAEEQSFLDTAAAWAAAEGRAPTCMVKTCAQALAYALNDSPAGLAGWIVRKFRGWSDCGGRRAGLQS